MWIGAVVNRLDKAGVPQESDVGQVGGFCFQFTGKGPTLWCQIVHMGRIKTSWVIFVKPLLIKASWDTT